MESALNGDSDSTRPRLSIILATWQAATTLERCLASTVEQTFKDWELVVADGASTDGSVDIIRSYDAHIAWWVSEKDAGIYDAWNTALGHARGEYVCFIGADDYWANPEALARLFDAINGDAYDLVTSVGQIENKETGKVYKFGAAFDFRRIGPRAIVSHPGLLHRRALFDEHGLFNTGYKIAADLEFLLRLPASTRALHVDAVIVNIDAGGVSRSNVLSRLREQREVLKRCPRYGPVRAYLVWLDKLWRYPIAQLFGIAH
jgi:glycosyltransferase involved in cell wall biosynthesis